MEAIIIHPNDKEQLIVIEYFLYSLKIPFDKIKVVGSVYNSEFNEKMERAIEDKKTGRYKFIKTEDLWK